MIISIHAPANGATDVSISNESASAISIHAPANGATIYCHYFFLPPIFQSTLRRTERPLHVANTIALAYFNPRSGERSDVINTYHPDVHKYFNPRSGERSDSITLFNLKSFTYFNPRSGERSDYCANVAGVNMSSFQSTLRRTERRDVRGREQPCYRHFNPRSGERSDPKFNPKIVRIIISIHAPANGATDCRDSSIKFHVFQSTLRRTERLIYVLFMLFQ